MQSPEGDNVVLAAVALRNVQRNGYRGLLKEAKCNFAYSRAPLKSPPGVNQKGDAHFEHRLFEKTTEA